MVMKNTKQANKGFKTLWIKFDESTTDKHQLFIKEHSIRNQDSQHPKGRTLFVLNVPPYVTVQTLKSAFNNLCDSVENVFFANTQGFKTAYIVFQKESTLEEILEISDEHILILNNERSSCITGLEKWCIDYNNSIRNENEMKMEIESYMQNYDEQVDEKQAREKALGEETEENDGWVTVSGQKKRGQFAVARKASTINKIQSKEQEKYKKKQLLNFYTFQIRESRKQNLAELRKKFELDKKKLQELKSKRTFKPF